jgi:hypothetical protein
MHFIFDFLLTICCFPVQAAVWSNTNEWNQKWEIKYQEWVKKNWDKDFYKRETPYKNLRVDCADAVYTMRYAFAAENGLPFAIKDPTGGSTLLSNQITRWDSEAPEQRKRSFLQYLFDAVSTQSMPRDTYPVAVSRQTITSGAVLLTDASSHHSWTIKYVSETGIPFLVFSSRPAKSIMFTRYEYPTTSFTFPTGLKPETQAGFRAFRTPEQLGLAVWEVSGYSLEPVSYTHLRAHETM